MNQKQKKRLLVIVTMLVLLSSAGGLLLYALKQNINLFYTPTELLAASSLSPTTHLRVGGYVKKGSVTYAPSGEEVRFEITDRVKEVFVNFKGVLPSLFREGQGVVVTGQLQNGIVLADEVLAKHDEKYMPKAIRHLKKGEGYGT